MVFQKNNFWRVKQLLVFKTKNKVKYTRLVMFLKIRDVIYSWIKLRVKMDINITISRLIIGFLVKISACFVAKSVLSEVECLIVKPCINYGETGY